MFIERRVLSNLIKGGDSMRVLWAGNLTKDQSYKIVIPNGSSINSNSSSVFTAKIADCVKITTGTIYFEGYGYMLTLEGVPDGGTYTWSQTLTFENDFITCLGDVPFCYHTYSLDRGISSYLSVVDDELVIKSVMYSKSSIGLTLMEDYCCLLYVKGTVYEVNI